MDLKTLKINPANQSRKKSKPKESEPLSFGRYYSDHFFIMKFTTGKGWHDPEIKPYTSLELDPAALVLHYGQAIFEGLKAYRTPDGSINLFRPRSNFERFNASAHLLCMPKVAIDFAVSALKKLVALDRDWVPRQRGSSLYIRPTMIASEAALGVRPANEYLFFIITGPVGAYYAEGFSPVKIYVASEHVRAVRGGVGSAKTPANYAASLFAAEKAKKMGFTQVLWLDAIEMKYIEEVGTMNIFIYFKDKLVTPPLAGTILPGITRDSVLKIVKKWGVKVSEEPVSIEQLISAIGKGEVREIFGTGTAAVISPVGEIYYKNKAYAVSNGKVGELSQKLYEEIFQIQYGEKPDPYGWVEKVEE